jgi:hypothetical protein
MNHLLFPLCFRERGVRARQSQGERWRFLDGHRLIENRYGNVGE